MGRSGARLLGRKTSGSYEQEYVRTGEDQASQKDKKDSSKHVGEPSKGGCSRPRDMICRQHEFVMGHHRDPTVRYLAIALLTYRRLRPSSRCSQSSVNTGERFFSTFLLRRNVQNTRCRNTSPTRSTIVCATRRLDRPSLPRALTGCRSPPQPHRTRCAQPSSAPSTRPCQTVLPH